MKKEIWKDILGYEGLYQVSNFGRVKSLERLIKYTENKIVLRKCRIIKTNTNKCGYVYVVLHKDGIKKMKTIHRLVAEAFLDNPDNLPQVNHKDENKLNNSVENLEWCDAKYNVNYGTALTRRTIKKSKIVYQYDLKGNFIREWSSTMECGRNGYNQGSVSACCRGKRKYHKDCIWKYKEDY